MAGAREAMAAHGAYYPKGPYRRRKAGWALGIAGAPRGAQVPMRHWHKLVDEVRAAGAARVCVSDENYARAGREQVERIVRDLGDTDVYVVAGARRLDRLLPSYWQERVKMGHIGSWEGWLETILGDDHEAGEAWRFWQSQDTPRLIERWNEFLQPDRFTLVVADEGDRLQLFRIFSEMLGLPDGVLAPDPHGSNESLSWSEVEVLRALQGMYRENGWPTDHFGEKLRPVIDSFRARRGQSTGPRTPPLPSWALDRVRALSDERADAVAKLPVRVVGDLDSLRVVDPPPAEEIRTEDLGLSVGLVVGAVEGMLRAERAAAEEQAADASLEERPAGELSGRELLRLARRRLGRRFRRS
jgi:hypothetical protein